MNTTVPVWATKLMAVAMLVIAYVMQNNWIPPGYMLFGKINLAGALTGVIALFSMLGISGPQLAPKVAALLGNPGTSKPTPVVPPPSPPDVPR